MNIKRYTEQVDKNATKTQSKTISQNSTSCHGVLVAVEKIKWGQYSINLKGGF